MPLTKPLGATGAALAVTLALAACLCLAAPAAAAGPKELITAGNQAAQAGRYDQAIRLYTRAIESGGLSDQNLAVAYANRGSAKDDSGRTDQAVKDFNRALELDPDHAEAYYNRSFAYEKKGLIPLAVADMEKAVRLAPEDTYYTDRLKYLNAKLRGEAIGGPPS
jgi:tetratricopeptide (TPR) repeat protein